MKITTERTQASALNFALLLGANAVLGSAMPMLIILGGLAGLTLAPTPALATLPASVQTLAGLVAAAPFSLMMGRFGRRAGFVAGAALAATGGAAAAVGLLWGSFPLLLLGHVALGAALACFQFFRFAAAEVVPDRWRPVAISLMLTSGLIAAFAGPEVFTRTKDALAPVPFAGAYAAVVVLSAAGVLPLPFVRGLARASRTEGPSAPSAGVMAVLRRPTVAVAIAAAAVSQGVMILLMVPTPIAIVGCGFAEAAAGDVVRWHVVAMFAPSFVTGFLIKRFGTTAVVATGLALLGASAVIAASGLTIIHFYAALVVLGVGWNLGFVGATALLADVLAPSERAAVQGINDTAIALAASICAFASGALVVGAGWTALALAALPVVASMALALLWIMRGTKVAA
ncbi:MFS transporter [Leisingera sp.]|uniref:MFS transporter n=1 Tax=Leisingera sp. TaxID=1879318 RepID=UPI002B26C560|nr:MFS transporter [Leisingera sp.]